MEKFRCIKTFAVDKYDEDLSMIENEETIIESGSVWARDPDFMLNLMTPEDGLRLCNDDLGWLEISHEQLKECFEVIESD